MMNRQIRRAQAKQDKRAEREKEERREARKRKVQQLREKRAARRAEARTKASAPRGAAAGDGAAEGQAKPRKPNPKAGRFSGALTMATVFFIVLQSAVPPDDTTNDLLRSITGAGFYMLFGYFSVMWLMRRGAPKAMVTTWITGGLLLVGIELTKYFQGVVPIDPLMLAMAVPGIFAGTYLGRLVFDNTPA